MCKKLILLISILVLSLPYTSQAIVIGDFEDGLDGWAPAGDNTLTLSTIGATSGAGSVLIEGPGSWQMLSNLDIKAIRSVLGVDGAAISADVTAFAEDMETDWMNMEMIINGQNDDANGVNNNIGWQSLGGLDIVRDGVTQTLYWELPADLSTKIAGTDDNIAWFELFIVTNNGATNTKIYIDNIQMIGVEPEPEPEPEPGAKIVYVDATEGEAGNTLLATGETFTSTEDGSGSDNLWRGRVFANSGTIFESGGQYGDTANPEDCPRLMTLVDVPENDYEVYVYFWADTSTWRIQASLTDSEGDLPLFLANDPNFESTVALADDFAEPVPMLTEGNRTLWQAYLGTTGLTTMISVYIDDDAASITHNARTWYDGIGYKAVPVPEPEPEKPKIIWVSFHGADDAPSTAAADVGFTEASDKGYTDLLKANGYDVERYITSSSPDPEVLNAADLVIIGRAVASGGYSNDGATAWNNISAPMIIMGGYVLRSSRMGYTTGTTMVDTTGDVALTVTDPTHPIFAGIALTDGTMDNPFAGGAVVLPTDGVTVSRGISINNDPADDEGTILATISEASADTGPVGGMVIAEWPAGATLTHDGGAGTDVLAGHRLVFLTGSREPDGVTGGDAAGLYDLYPDGEQMLLNAVDYMIPVVPVDPGTDGLVAYYALENDVNDSSGNGLDGVVIGDPNFVDGVEGMALDFNGDDYVDCGGVAEFSFTESMTVSAWVNIRSVTTAWMAMVAKGENAWRLGVNNTTTGIHYGFTGGTRGWQAANSATELPFDEWHHVAATYDTNVGALVYIDGVLDASNPDLGGVATNEMSLLLGENPEATGRLFDGMLDEVAIYNRALSEAEILYLAGFRVEETNILANGGFEDGVMEPWSTYGNVTTEVVSELTDANVPEAPVEGAYCLHVVVPEAGANSWDAGLQNAGHVFEAGKQYTLSANVKSKAGTLDIHFKPERAADPWEGYGDTTFTMTEEWTEFSVETGVIPEDVDPASITFHIAFAAGDFWIDDVKFYETE